MPAPVVLRSSLQLGEAQKIEKAKEKEKEKPKSFSNHEGGLVGITESPEQQEGEPQRDIKKNSEANTKVQEDNAGSWLPGGCARHI